MPFFEKGLVVSHQQIGRGMYELEMIIPAVTRECQPGQFIHIRLGAFNDPLLRRPLSIYDADKKLGSITLLYKVVGRGTEMLTRIRTKEYVDIMGPLGNGFTIPAPGSRVLLVGGGAGIAPLVYLSRVLRENNCQLQVLYGTATQSEMAAFNKLREIGVDFTAATVDGSLGYRGAVTDLLNEKNEPEDIDYIYTCGPEPMMAIVADYARRHGIAGEVSLEEYMACGIGACLGCARKLKASDEDYVKVCKDGPVFSLYEIEL